MLSIFITSPIGVALLISLATWLVAPTAVAQEVKPAIKKPSVTAPAQTSAPKAARFASAETPLRLEITSATFRLRLRVEAPEKDQLNGVTVEVPVLFDASGKAVPIKCEIQGKPCSQGVSIPGFSSALVDLSADLASPGEYTTWVMLKSPGGADTRQLVVTRKLRSTATFSALGVEPGTDGVLWLTVSDTAGMATKLRVPTVAALTRNQPNRPKAQADFNKIAAFAEDGTPLPDPFDLPADASRRIKLKFEGLEPGSYEGKLILGSLDSGRQEVTVSLSQRLSLFIALLVISVGVVLSHFLREWASTRRPVLIKRRDLFAAREAYEALVFELDARDALERRVIAAIGWALQEPDEDLVEGTLPADFDATLARIKRKIEVLPAWIGVRRRIQGLEPAKLRGQFQKTLEDGQAYLLAPRAAANEDQLIASVMGLDAQVSEAVRAELRAQFAALRTDVDESIKDARNAALRTRLQGTVRPAIDAVEGRIENNDPAAGPGLNAARLEYAKALAEDLVATLDGPPAAPFAADRTPDEWTQLRTRVSALLETMQSVLSGEAQGAIEAYELAYREYLDGLVGKAKRLIADQEKIAATISNADQKAKLVSRLDALKKALVAVNKKARDRKLREAAREWEEAWAEYVEIDKAVAVATGGSTLGAATAGKITGATSAGGTLPEGITDRPEPMPRAPAVRARVDREGLAARIRSGDSIFTAVVLLIAVLLGAKLLWIDNPSWGGYDDWLIALLWGLGLHQGSAGAFEGLAGLKAKFAK